MAHSNKRCVCNVSHTEALPGFLDATISNSSVSSSKKKGKRRDNVKAKKKTEDAEKNTRKIEEALKVTVARKKKEARKSTEVTVEGAQEEVREGTEDEGGYR